MPSEFLRYCYRFEMMSLPFNTPEQWEKYEQMKMYLNCKDNPKYHFFIVDSQSAMSSNQWAYMAYIETFDFISRFLLDETTQGISIIVSKCDEFSPNSSEWPRLATNYVKDCYPALINRLKQMVDSRKNGDIGLIDGRLKVIPFSIGEVFFRNLCVFNPESAKILIDLLMRYADEGEKIRRWLWRHK